MAENHAFLQPFYQHRSGFPASKILFPPLHPTASLLVEGKYIRSFHYYIDPSPEVRSIKVYSLLHWWFLSIYLKVFQPMYSDCFPYIQLICVMSSTSAMTSWRMLTNDDVLRNLCFPKYCCFQISDQQAISGLVQFSLSFFNFLIIYTCFLSYTVVKVF